MKEFYNLLHANNFEFLDKKNKKGHSIYFWDVYKSDIQRRIKYQLYLSAKILNKIANRIQKCE